MRCGDAVFMMPVVWCVMNNMLAKLAKNLSRDDQRTAEIETNQVI